MVLQQDEYEIRDEGIWIKKSVLEEWKKHYCKVADKKSRQWMKGVNKFSYPFYIGKANTLADLLKMFDELEGE